jgi:hypothetical protein
MQTEQAQTIDGRYTLGRLTASHGHVELFEAHDRQLDRAVTIQLLSEDAAKDPAAARAFQRHQQLAGAIHNCPIFTVYDAGSWMGRPYSVMEREKGVHPAALRRPGYPPDNAVVLRVMRQVAEALECCRKAGLSDWTFSPEAVRIDRNGNGCLSIIEGFGGLASSSDPAHDAPALASLLTVMLTGSETAGEPEMRAALVPDFIVRLADRVGGSDPGIRTAGDVASEVAAIESTSLQATQAYLPPPEEANGNGGKQMPPPVVSPPVHAPEAPTLQAPLPAPAQVTQATATESVLPYAPVEPVPAAQDEQRRVRWSPFLLGGLALLIVLALAAQPLLFPKAAVQGAPAGSTSAANTGAFEAPDVRGKDIDEARDIAGGAGLNLAVGDPLHNLEVAADRVAVQEPPPGTLITPGSLITVSLSLGPEATPTQPPPPVVEEPSVQEPPAPPPEEREKKRGKKNDKDDKDD